MGLKKVFQIKEVQKQKKEEDESCPLMTIGYSACPTELTAQHWKVNESGAQQTNWTSRNLKLVKQQTNGTLRNLKLVEI
jgi:hypothetical protein